MVIPMVVCIHHHLADDEVQGFWAHESGTPRLLAVYAVDVACNGDGTSSVTVGNLVCGEEKFSSVSGIEVRAPAVELLQ